MTTPSATALPDAQAMPDWAQLEAAQTEDAKSKAGKGQGEVSSAATMPTAPGAGETKPAAAPAAPIALADRAALMQQAEGSLHALHAQVLGQGRGQMTLQLHPQDWGKLQVSVTMTPDAKGSGGTAVTAHVVADSAAVKQALETGNADLRRTLREAGLHLERFTVTVRPAEAGGEAQLGSGSGGNGRQQPQDAQSWTTPGSQGSNTGSASAGNGGNTFGGGGANSGAHTPTQTQTTLSARSATDEQEMQAAPALSGINLAARLDTRA